MTEIQFQDQKSSSQPLANPVDPAPQTPSGSVEQEVVTTSQQHYSLYLVVIIIIASIFGGWFIYKHYYGRTNTPDSNISPSSSVETTTNQTTQTKMEKYFNTGSARVGIPEKWEISISQKTDSLFSARIYPPMADKTTTFAEIQVGDSATMSTNILLTFSSEVVENGLTIREGKENLLKSNRSVLQVEQLSGSTKALITFFGSNEDLVSNRQTMIDMLAGALESNHIDFNLVGRVRAQDNETEPTTTSTVIAGIPLSQAKTIEIMDGPYPERITDQDTPYKGGYAKLYKFDYIKGQRVEILAEENSEDLTSTGSFIQSELYYFNSETNDLTNIMTAGTRVSPHGQIDMETGTYYFLVNTYPNKVGRFLVKIFDLDQVNDLYYAKYSDGSEHPLNTGARVSSMQEAVLLVRFTGPIELVGDSQVRWFRKTDNACISSCLGGYAYGDVTVPFSVQVNQVNVPIKITKLFMNQAIIQPAGGGGFPVNSNISFSLDFGEDPNNPGSSSGYTGGFGTY